MKQASRKILPPQDLIATFENRYVDPLRADECRERLALLFEKGLKSPLACKQLRRVHFQFSPFPERLAVYFEVK